MNFFLSKWKVKILFYISGILFSFSLSAATPLWQVNANNSKVIFTATQNNAPISGEFKGIGGQIYFDPQRLDLSYGKIEIDMSSLVLSFKELETILKSPEWFNTLLFPKATFIFKEVRKKDGNNYEAIGNLQIRDITLLTVVPFTLQNYSTQKFQVIGTLLIKRTEFEVGQGEWVDTTDIKNEVKITFTLDLLLKFFVLNNIPSEFQIIQDHEQFKELFLFWVRKKK